MFKQIYDNLIVRSKSENRVKSNDVYYENHHIIPKHMNGSDNIDNLVLLTFKEHIIAHYLLWRIYKKDQDLIAYKMRSGQKEEAQRLRSRLAVESNRNGGNGFFKTGGWNPMKDPLIQEKSQETKLSKYGNRSICSESQYQNICKANRRMANDENKIKKFKESLANTIDSMTYEERQEKYARFGETNGNYGKIKGRYEVIDPEGNVYPYESQNHIIESLKVSQSFLVRNRNNGKIENKSSNSNFHKWNGWEFIYTKN